ncbi:MAG TPA: TonB-dependent receptor [Caulobacteraceae bacterium]
MTRLQFFTGAALAALTTLPAAAWAADADSAADVDTLVVVANRNPEPLYRIGQAVTVLDAKSIAASQAVSVSDLLDQTPGVTVVRNGGVGQTSSLGIRGALAEQTLVLIDGVQLNDPSSPGAGFDFSNLLAGDVSRIEILRGSQSTLWGSQAIGGVVNIVTAPPSKALQGDFSAEGGSRDTQYYRGGLGGTIDRLSFRVAGGYYSTSGISAFDKAFGGKEPDGFNAGAFSGRLLFDATSDIQLDLRAYYTQSKTAFDGFPAPNYVFADDSEYGTIRQFVDYTGLNIQAFGGRLKNRLAFEYASTNRHLYDPADAPVTETFYGDGATTRFEYQGTADLAPGYTAVFGAQHERTTLVTDTPAFDFVPTAPLRAAFTIDSGYAQVQGEVVRGLTLTGGVRYDSHNLFGGRTTAQAAAAWSLNGGDTILRASWSQGFKAPSLYQIYSTAGNPALKPETSDSLDAGVEQRLFGGRVVLGATYFRLSSHQLIEFTYCEGSSSPLCPNFFDGFYDNVAQALSQGVELQGSATLFQGLTVSGNYTYTDAEDRTPGPDFGTDLARRPRHTANATVSYLWPIKLTTTLAVRYASRSFDRPGNSTPLHGYTVVDLRASYPVTEKIEVYGRVENLFDEHYETAFRYGTLGRGAFVGVRAKF